MERKSSETKLLDWLNVLIVMAQWDRSLPLYFGRLIKEPDQYQNALQLIRQTPPEGPLPKSAGGPLSEDEWQKLYKLTSGAAPLRQLFAGDRDPFEGGSPNEISLLAEVSDLTTDPQTMFYSRNGTFHLVLEAVRQRSELDTAELITDSLNKFYTLLDTNVQVAELLYQLACSNDWHLVLASLYDRRDYNADESATTKETLEKWNQTLNTELRSILLRPTKLFRVPRSLVKLAWEKRSLFEKALNSIPQEQRRTGFELRQQVSNVVYPLFVAEVKEEVEVVETELQLLAAVTRHYIGVRKFAKLDGLVYAWPKIASLAMSNYANLEYLEDFLVEKKPRPTETELDARDARELFELCENNAGLIRFLRLRPYFKEIDEDELRRYRPLAPVMISDSAQSAQSTVISPATASITATPSTPSIGVPTRICELVINKVSTSSVTDGSQEIEYEVSLILSNNTKATGIAKFSTRKLLDRMLQAIGVHSDDSLQSVLKENFAGTNAEQILLRAGTHLQKVILTQTGLEQSWAAALADEGAVRLIISTNDEDLHYLPWEWLPRPQSSELLLSHSRFSLVRSDGTRSDAAMPALIPPIRMLGVFPNSPTGGRTSWSETSMRALESVTNTVARYQKLPGNDATLKTLTEELKKFLPEVVHFEGYVDLKGDGAFSSSELAVLLSGDEAVVSVDLTHFAAPLTENRVQLMVIGKNQSSRVYGNPGPILSSRLNKLQVPAVLAPIRAVDDVTATAFTTEFYTAFFAGNSLEQALHIARRKVASRGGDWTAFALFANPTVLDFFQPLPPIGVH